MPKSMSPRTQKTGWHKEDIKAEIRKRGETLTSLAKKNGLGSSCVRAAMVRPYTAAERVVAAFLGKPLHELWPDRWTPDGERIRPRYAQRISARS